MSKNKVYNQKRTADFQINTIVSVDIDALRLRFGNMPEEQIQEKVEKAWNQVISALVSGEVEDYDEIFDAAEAFAPGLVKAKLIPNSLRVTSTESYDVEDGEEDH